MATLGYRMELGMRAFVLIALSAALLCARVRIPSPDNKFYAVEEKSQKVGQGEEIERVSIFTADGKLVSVLHVWLTEPDGMGRIYFRGCESSGWIDSTRFFCEGSFNPSQEIYRWFDVRTGKEIGETAGSEFTWSPDHTKLAQFGNVGHFWPEDVKSDWVEIGSKTWPANLAHDPEQHWFRSVLTWSPDSKLIAVVDHQRRIRKAFFLEIVDAKTGKATEHKLQWPDEADEWYPDHDFIIEWTGNQVTVEHADVVQTFSR